MAEPSLSVVGSTPNRDGVLTHCLEGLLAQDHGPVRLSVVEHLDVSSQDLAQIVTSSVGLSLAVRCLLSAGLLVASKRRGEPARHSRIKTPADSLL